MQKLFILVLFCSFTTLLHAQQRKNEVSVSWMPVDPPEQSRGFQITYFRHLRSWYHLGGSIFHFATLGNIAGSSFYTDKYHGITFINKFTTSERFRIGAYFNCGIAVFRANSVQLRTSFPVRPITTTLTTFRFEDKYFVGGNLFSGGVYVKPHKRFKIGAAINLFLNWIEIDQNSTELEPYFETGCFDFNVAWQF
jgi:hypothetical protein